MNKIPKISVIMPVYNTKEEWLREAIESILNQTFSDFEFVIINDGSTNNAEEVILSYKDERIRYVKQENQGVARSLNNGLGLAKGEYIARMDSDDVSLLDRFEKQVNYLNNNKDVSLIGGWIEFFPKEDMWQTIENPKVLDFYFHNQVAHPTVMFRKADFEKYNLKYDPNFVCEDYELWSRAIRYLDIYNLQEVLLKYRWDGQNISAQKEIFTESEKSIRKNVLEFLTQDQELQNKIYDLLLPILQDNTSFVQKLFSIKNSSDKTKKIIRVLGIKITIKKHPIVHNSQETLTELINTNKSITRFGDGEFNIILGQDISFQKYSPKLAQRLKNILQNNNDNILTCIPNIFKKLTHYNKKALRFWKKYLKPNREKIYLQLDFHKQYYDSQITRAYIDLADRSNVKNYFNDFKKVWKNKDIIIVEGYASRLGVNNDLFNNAKSIKRIICPPINAFDKYEEILNECKKQTKNNLFILALGPTATVLSYDLSNLGYRALDLGHIDIEYEWFLAKATTKIAIQDKFVNEVLEGRQITTINDNEYLNQIIKDFTQE